jgi:hypothetical protein
MNFGFLFNMLSLQSSERYLSSTAQDLWCSAVLKRGYGGCNIEGELGIEVPFEKGVTMGEYYCFHVVFMC